MSDTGYIKRTAITTYRSQRRGGRGRIGMKTKEEDFVAHLFVASTHDYLMIFSDRGRAYWLKVHEIPEVVAAGKGKAIANLVSMQPHERIAAVLTVRDWEEGKFVVMGTRRGVIKKTALPAFSNPRAGGIIAMGIEEDDAVIAASISDGSGHVLIATRNGMAIRFEEADVRTTGRGTYGVRGIELRDDDVVVAMEVLRDDAAVLTLTENGYGKRTAIDEYRVTGRGGLGIINIQTTGRNGRVVGVACVTETDEVMFITQQGMVLRTPARNVSIIGRNTQGVRLIDMDEGDRAVSVARLEEQETEGGAGGPVRQPGWPRSGRPGDPVRRAPTRSTTSRPGRIAKEAGMGRHVRTSLALLLSAMTLAAAVACSVMPRGEDRQGFLPRVAAARQRRPRDLRHHVSSIPTAMGRSPSSRCSA